MGLKEAWAKFVRLHEEYFQAPYRQAMAREARKEEDLFLLLVFSEMMGLPNPANFYLLELQPHLLNRFHQWHTRMGLPHSPLDSFKCC